MNTTPSQQIQAAIGAHRNGSSAGVAIQRHVAPPNWVEAINAMPPDEQDAAREFLRGIAQRMRNVRAMRGAA